MFHLCLSKFIFLNLRYRVQYMLSSFSWVAQSCPTLCDSMDCSMPGFSVHHQFPELPQTHVHRVGDVIPPSHPLLSPSPPAFNLSQHWSFPMSQYFASGGQSIGASASVLPINIQDWFPLGLTGLISLHFKGLSRVFSNTTVQNINSSVLNFIISHLLYHYCWVTSVLSHSTRPHRWQPTRLPRPWDSPGKNTGVGCHSLLQCMKMKSKSEFAQSSPTQRPRGLQPTRLIRPWDFPGKSLEWVTITFSIISLIASKYLFVCSIKIKICKKSPLNLFIHLFIWLHRVLVDECGI